MYGWRKWLSDRLQRRFALVLIAGFATAMLYAEGVLKNGWIEVLLLAPVAWFLFAPRMMPSLQNFLLSLAALCLVTSVVDLFLRPMLGHRLHYTPTNIAARKFPRLPIVGRWDPNLNFDVESYGDLAAMVGDAQLREPRNIVFKTDAAGFRNASDPGVIDLLVLGDSFGAGAGTTQDKIFARVLEIQYGRHTYNLSYPGGPYDQFINLAIESSRLTLSPDAKLVWTFYTGNDLDDSGGQTWDLDQLPWRRGFAAWLVTYRTFRNRSPLNQWMETLRWRFHRRFSNSASDVIIRTLPDGRAMLFQGGHEAWGKRALAEVERHPNFAKLERTLAAIKELTTRKGLDVTILIFPTKGEVYRWILDQREPKDEDAESSGFAMAVLGACERVALRCVDTKLYLVKEAHRLDRSTGELLWWRDDTHLGEHGHAAVAALIAQEILNRDHH